MKLFKQLRKDFWRLFFTHPAALARLARLQACRLNGQKAHIYRIIPLEGGDCFLYVVDSFGGQMCIYVDGPIDVANGTVKLKYRTEPEESTLMMFGRHHYRCRPEAYLVAISI